MWFHAHKLGGLVSQIKWVKVLYIYQQSMTIYVTESRDSNSRYVVKAIKSFNGPRA